MKTPSPERRLFEIFAPSVAYVSVEHLAGERRGDQDIGTCFHIGDHVFITARHIVEKVKILKVGTTNPSIDISFGSYLPTETNEIEGPFFHPDEKYDLAALRIPKIKAAQIPFQPSPEDESPDAQVLRTVVVMGYPPIPGNASPVLLCTRAEVNASFVTYFDHQRVLIVSCLGRGGFSGGPALTPPHHCLGVVTRSLCKESLPAELGFMAVVGPWPVLELLNHHDIMPSYLRDEIWNRRKALNAAASHSR